MKPIFLKEIFLIIALIVSVSAIHAQQKVIAVKKGKNVVVVNKKSSLHHRAVVYRPVWAKKSTYYRRWVYFPRLHLYWDNHKSRYVYLVNNHWVVYKTIPKPIANVDLENEKNFELSEKEDSVETIQENIEIHEKQYK